MVTMEEAIGVKTQDKQLLLSELRYGTDTTFKEIGWLKKSIEYLIAEFDLHRSLSNETSNSIETFTERIIVLEDIFKQVTNPLMKFACKSKSIFSDVQSSELSLKSDTSDQNCDSAMTVVFITNLNEFMCEAIISEYLRQNEIFVGNCKQVTGYNERSRNFRVVIKKCDVPRILDSNLWPKGVTTSIRDPLNMEYKEAVYGSREIDLPGIVITPGMSYWHDV